MEEARRTRRTRRKRNGMRHNVTIRDKAILLRKNGKTHREIARELMIGVGTAHLWTKGLVLTPDQKKAVWERVTRSVFTAERRKKLSEWAKVNLARYRKEYLKKELIDKVQEFYKENGRIPLKREFNMYHEYKIRFGSWNNAIRLAGFKPNEVIFSKRFTAKDGHICDSFAEKLLDDWLMDVKIEHTRHDHYGNTRMTADFRVGNTVIEYFGLSGASKRYNEIIVRKRYLCKKLKLSLIEIYPDDLFKGNFRNFLKELYARIT